MSLDRGGLGEGLLPMAGGVGDRGWTKADCFLCPCSVDRTASQVPGLHSWMGSLRWTVLYNLQIHALPWNLPATPTPNSALRATQNLSCLLSPSNWVANVILNSWTRHLEKCVRCEWYLYLCGERESRKNMIHSGDWRQEGRGQGSWPGRRMGGL